MCAQLPEHAESHLGAGIVGVPGFWQELSGVVHIWKPRNYLMPLLVIPCKDANGLIQACQIRLHANDISSDEKRYCWLSSPQERRGTSSGTPIHFTFIKEKLPPGETVLITVGALKADIVVRFRSNARVIATSGVTCSHSELVKAARSYPALIAFDSDHRINPAVCRQLARLIVQRLNDSREQQLRSTTNVICWNGPKGIDDAQEDRRATVPFFTPEALKANMPLLSLVRDWALRKGVTPVQFSLGWLLAQKPWIVPIPGTTNPHHLNENLGAAGVKLTPDELREIRAAISNIKVQGARSRESALTDQ